MIFEAALDALGILADPLRLAFVACGTVLGLLIGVIPGIGGLVGLALLLPFTFAMDPYTALAFLVGVQSVTTTSDTIPAVLFGVPGTVGSAATVLDGHPMARRGEAGRAYGAAFTASVCGGLFGALLLALSIPLLRPFILAIGTPELLAICLLGLTLVVSLSRRALAKGLVAAAAGLLLATVGDEPQTGELRWTFDLVYLWDGLSLVPVALGLFAVPEIIDLAVSRGTIAGAAAPSARWQQLQGVRDVLRNWWLVLRCSAIGSLLGAIPGVGASVIDWIAYGYAARVVKGAEQSFGRGDVRGVIASESSNNAKEGGALVPTLAFGVPGSASMALLLGAFLIHGIAPGPNMLGPQLDVTFTLIWTVAIANVLGAGLCFAFAGQFARVARIRAGILVPLVFGIMVIGAYQGAQDYGDLVVLALFGALGWVMKRLGWPRPPLVLAFVLGGLIENYLFISHLRYGIEWALRPVPLAVLAVMVLMFAGPWLMGCVRRLLSPAEGPGRARGDGSGTVRVRASDVSPHPSPDPTPGSSPDPLPGSSPDQSPDQSPDTSPDASQAASPAAGPGGAGAGPHALAGGEGTADLVVWTGAGVLFAAVLLTARDWELAARLLPQTIAVVGLAALGLVSLRRLLVGPRPAHDVGPAHPLGAVLRQAAWLLGLIVGVALFGMLPAMGVFVVAYMRAEGGTGWARTAAICGPFWLAVYLLFHRTLHIPWPRSMLGDWLPALRAGLDGIL